MKRIIIVVLIFLSVFAVNAQSVDYLGKAKKNYAEGNCKLAKEYLGLYVKLGGAVDKAVRDFSAEVDKCLYGKDKSSSEKVECTYSVKTVYNDTSETTTYVESASGVAQGGHEYVDLGLSVKWATCNVGANKPEDYGYYFAWGETSTKWTYSESNSKTYGKQMYDIKGKSKYDAARANWGGTWRLPTKAEMQELIDKCNWKWMTHNGVKGYKVTGPNGNSIFLPAAGYSYGSSLSYAAIYGGYWSSTSSGYGGDYACELYFYSNFHGMRNYSRCIFGRSVRPVIE